MSPRVSKPKHTLTASHVADFVMHYIMERQAVCCPNCYFTGYEADILVVDNRNHKLIDIEIKVDRSDLKADFGKDKWGAHDRRTNARRLREFAPEIWKHYYVMPAKVWKDELVESIPSTSGVILIETWDLCDRASFRVVRRPKCNPDAKPLSPDKILNIARLANLRYLKERTQMQESRKIGRVKIAGFYFRGLAGGENPDHLIRAFFTKFYPVHIDHDGINDIVEYVGICDDFRAVPQGEIVPTYTCRFDSVTGGMTFEEYRSSIDDDEESYIIKP